MGVVIRTKTCHIAMKLDKGHSAQYVHRGKSLLELWVATFLPD